MSEQWWTDEDVWDLLAAWQRRAAMKVEAPPKDHITALLAALAPTVERIRREAKAEALREFAGDWSRWLMADAPQLRGGAAYRARAEADRIEADDA